MVYTVRQIAQLAGVSVRTLHYYDQIDLLKPGQIQENKYRLYGEPELRRLQQILFFRELDFPLQQIRNMLDAPDFSEQNALEDHKKLLQAKKKRIDRLITTIEHTLQSFQGGEQQMKTDDMFDAFSMDQIEQYKQEARDKWGHTNAYQQSTRRFKNATQEDYQRIAANWNRIITAYAGHKKAGKPITHPDVQQTVDEQYAYMQTFYDCSYEMFRGIADLYVQDPRFTKTYEDVAPGLAQYVRDSIHEYCSNK